MGLPESRTQVTAIRENRAKHIRKQQGISRRKEDEDEQEEERNGAAYNYCNQSTGELLTAETELKGKEMRMERRRDKREKRKEKNNTIF